MPSVTAGEEPRVGYQQNEQDIDREIVGSVEIYWLFQRYQAANGLATTCNAAMRYCNTCPQTGTAQAFASDQLGKNIGFRQAGVVIADHLCERLEESFFAAARGTANRALWRQQFRKNMHEKSLAGSRLFLVLDELPVELVGKCVYRSVHIL